MQQIEKTIFISYRRTNSSWALAIFQDLTQHGYDVFLDFNGIASGDFERVILANIRARAHFLVLLTPSALERCHEPADWLRREIETALVSKRNIVPIMLEEFSFATPGVATQLTGEISALKMYNGLQVPVAYFSEAMARLRQLYLNVPLDTVLHPVSVDVQQITNDQRNDAIAAPAVSIRDLSAEEWFERGVSASDLDQGILFFSEAIRVNPNYALAFAHRGSSRFLKRDRIPAMKDYNEAIRLDPKLAGAYSLRGLLRMEERDRTGAFEDYNQAIRLDPNCVSAFHNRAKARADKGDLDGSFQDYGEAIRIAPEPTTLTNRGNLYYRKGNLDAALNDYNEALLLKPNAVTFNQRGLVRSKKRDWEGALEDYNEALRLEPGMTHAHENRSEIMWKVLVRRLAKKLFS